MMRSDDDMFALILRFAREQRAVRAAVLNGSRANPNVRRDPFQDFDIVYLTNDLGRFTRQDWIPRYFGDIMILQLPDDMVDPPPDGIHGYTYLMQFVDGTRIDLGFQPLAAARSVVSDSLSVVLLDKDRLLDGTPPASDVDYLPSPPTRKLFDDCCNEFWWLNPYVAKGLWRDELPYAKHAMETLVRPQVMKMVTWDAAARTGYRTALGKWGKHLKDHLDPADWRSLVATYADGKPENLWAALHEAQKLFRRVALRVAQANGYDYPEREDRRVSDFVARIEALPRDVRDILDP